MSIIRQGSLFGIQDLYDLEPTQRFEAIFSTLNMEPLLNQISKKTIYGAPTELNYAAMIYAMVARIIERIPTIKDLLKRLKYDFIFRLDCGFLFSDQLPSESSFSRLAQKLENCQGLESVKNHILLQAIQEGFVDDDAVAMDATHFESRDQAKTEEKKPKPEPKKRGRKTKAEKEAYDTQKQEQEAQQTLFEKSIAAQLDVPFEELRAQIPLEPAWGIKKNSEGKNVFGMDLKGILL
jgi:transposase